MTGIVPDDVSYTPTDFVTATDRVRTARTKILANPVSAEAHAALGERISQRLERKQATLSEVRRAIGLTQDQLAASLGISQGDVSKIEGRHNLYVTTLARFIAATGGHLRITAVYDDTEVDLDLPATQPVEH